MIRSPESWESCGRAKPLAQSINALGPRRFRPFSRDDAPRLGGPTAGWLLVTVLFIIAPSSVVRSQDGPDAVPDEVAEIDRRWRTLESQGRLLEAVPIAREALAVRERLFGPEDRRTASGLLFVADLLRNGGRPAEAVPLYERALRISEKVRGRTDEYVLSRLIELAYAHRDLGESAKADAYLADCQTRAVEEFGPDDPILAKVTCDRAISLARLGRDAEARAQLDRAIALDEKAYGADPKHLAGGLFRLAEQFTAAAEPALAVSVLERAREHLERAGLGETDAGAAVRLGVGNALAELGRYEAAVRVLREAVAVIEAIDGRALPNALQSLARAHLSSGRPDLARPLLERVLAEVERVDGSDHPILIGPLGDLAHALSALGQDAEATELYARTLAIAEQSSGPDSQIVGILTTNLATKLLELGELDRARPLAERGLATLVRTLPGGHAQLAAPLAAVAMVRLREGHVLDAALLLERAEALARRAFGADHPWVAVSRSLLAHAYHGLGRRDEAAAILRSCLAILERARGEDDRRVMNLVVELAYLEARRGEMTEARALLERAVDSANRQVRLRARSATARERVAAAADARSVLDHWLGFTGDTGGVGYDAVLSLHGIVARVGEAEGRAQRAADAETRTMLDRLSEARRALARTFHARPAAGAPAEATWRERFARDKARATELELALAARSGRFRAIDGRLDLGLDDVRGRLGADEALVHYLVHRGAVSAWVIRPGDVAPVRAELGDPAAIESAAARFVDAVRSAESVEDEAFIEAGRGLAKLVWDPVAASLPETTRTVHLVPDGVLATVPFSALPDSGDGAHLVIDRLAISYLATAQDLVPWPGADAPASGLLAVGGIDYGEGDRFAPLAFSRVEVDAIAELVRAADPAADPASVIILEGAAATESALRRLAPGRRLLHLATHGFIRADDRSPKSEASPLGGGLQRHLVETDPMLAAGIALAGANRGGDAGEDDGILTALEASSLDLDAADLVVLSACDTARGTATAGEGVLGLVRGFRRAGARRVVASLWPVDDVAARDVCAEIHRGALAGEDLPGALRGAALAARDHVATVLDREASLLQGRPVTVERRPFAAPRHWAAFVSYGPPR